ncbi:hypothetical protein AAG906_003672 [Vitis piasezkii]
MSMSKNAWVSEVWNPLVTEWLDSLLQGHLMTGRLIWARVPPKVAFFAWKASWDGIKVCGKMRKRVWQWLDYYSKSGSLVESHSSLVNCSINVDEILLLLSGIEGTPLVVLTQGDLEEVNNLSKSTPKVKSFGTRIEVKFFQVVLCPNPCFQLRSTNCK